MTGTSRTSLGLHTVCKNGGSALAFVRLVMKSVCVLKLEGWV